MFCTIHYDLKNSKPFLVLICLVYESLLIRHHVLDACDEGIGSGSMGNVTDEVHFRSGKIRKKIEPKPDQICARTKKVFFLKTSKTEFTFINNFYQTIPWLPPTIFGVMCILGGNVLFLLPETLGKPLLNTVDEANASGFTLDFSKGT